MAIPLIIGSATAGAAAMYRLFGDDESRGEKIAAENRAEGIPDKIGTVRLLVIGGLSLTALYIAVRYIK